MARNDYRDRASQKFGKETVAYPYGDTNYPVITRSGNRRKGGPEIPFLTADAEYTGAFLINRASDKGDDDGENFTQIYETLPGPWLYDYSIDNESLAQMISKRRKNKISSISPGSTISGGNLIITERKDINTVVAWEIVTVLLPPAASDSNTAIVTQETRSYAMPERIDVNNMRLTGLTDTFYYRPRAEHILCNVYTYWVISDTAPSVPSDPIIPAGTVSLNSECSVAQGNPSSIGTFHGVLHDGFVETYGYNPCGFGNNFLPVAYAPTTPSFTEYNTSWRGQFKIIESGSFPGKFQKLWRVRVVKARMY